jgi:hypothetical protein
MNSPLKTIDPPAVAAQDTDHAPLLAMLHTVPGLVAGMGILAAGTVPGLRVLHYVDETLLQDTIAQGTTPGHVRRRLVNYARTPRNQVPKHCW